VDLNDDGHEPKPPRWSDRLGDLVDRHGDDYLQEGKKLLRRARRTVTIVGALAVLLMLAGVALAVRVLLR